ncbi:ABC transporter permease [Streptoalloteichus hindustanus]|uniref:Fluoroquinolone transport system permease protein n=1 Tax=Streptoalloteichus hindustanus TaxID=2017 RepID=A0A1M5P363_STRHI|nr:ABC transporter permease [Streptoalloteichus hindustanus]SHG95613.1 fluoroquinolone transport system permease protein [Streptoalloteichus hindustanus]
MTSAMAVFGRNDLRGVRRESLLLGVALAPLVWISLVRFATPPVTTMLAERYHVDLVPCYPLILTGFLLLTSPIVVGGVGSFLVLEERDSGTLAALRVTPVSIATFFGYRAITVLLVTAVYVVGTMTASGLLPLSLVPELVPIGLLTGLSGVVIALTILSVARNKVEGIAVVRGLGIVVAGLPLIPYFLDSDWQLLFGLTPTYWPSKAYWVADQGGAWWPYLLAGVVYNGLLIWALFRRFEKRIR